MGKWPHRVQMWRGSALGTHYWRVLCRHGFKFSILKYTISNIKIFWSYCMSQKFYSTRKRTRFMAMVYIDIEAIRIWRLKNALWRDLDRSLSCALRGSLFCYWWFRFWCWLYSTRKIHLSNKSLYLEIERS